jgi:molybdopterin-guanine dinucleotide biosynthesis protein A
MTGAILAGGRATRFGGTDKALLEVDGRSILDRLLDAFDGLFDEILLVTNDPVRYLPWDLWLVSDVRSRRSSLTGLHSALFYATGPHVFVAACDLPFLKRETVRRIAAAARAGVDVTVPETTDGIQPLCAVYAKSCLKPVEALLDRGEFRIRRFFPQVRVVRIAEAELREIDPDLSSFFNVNTPEALAEADRRSRSARCRHGERP